MNKQGNSAKLPIGDINSDRYSKSINSIRAIALIIIIISHSSSLTFTINFNNYFYYKMGALGVAIFTFLSGVVLTRAIVIKQNLNHSWIDWFKRRILRIFPLLILSTLFILIYNFFLLNEIYDLNSILIHMSGFQGLPTNPNNLLIMAPHWFITFILTCYLVFPLLFYFLNKKFNLAMIAGIIIYFLFFIFNDVFYNGIEYLFSEILHKEFKINFFKGYFPGFFIFFFGMSLGYKLGEESVLNKNLFNNKKIKLGLFFLAFSLLLLPIFLNEFFGINFNLFSRYNYLFAIVIFPSIAISSTVFLIIYLDNKVKINNFFNVLGNHSYEIFLIHLFPINILALLDVKLELYFIYLLIVVISNIILSHPFYYVGNWIKNKKRYHDSIITISLSLIIYSLFIYILQLETTFNNVGALILFLSILATVSVIVILKKFFPRNGKTYYA